MVIENRAVQTAYSLAVSNTPFSHRRGGFFVAGWELCYTQPSSCQRLRLWTPAERSGLRFSRSQNDRKVRWKSRRVTLDVEVKKREFLKVKWQPHHPMPPTGKWSKSVSQKRWMNHGWMRLPTNYSDTPPPAPRTEP